MLTTSDWLTSVFPGQDLEGPVEVLREKTWGTTATFLIGGRTVVVKHAEPPLYPQAAAVHLVVEKTRPDLVAPLLAHEDGPGWQRSVFGHVPGATAEAAGPEALVAVATALGRVQADLAEADLTDLPEYDVAAIPDTLFADLVAAADQEAELVDRLCAALPVLRGQSAELAGLPRSLDHPDMNNSNAILAEDGRIVLLDWEEAVVGCPLFSFNRLLADAEEAGNQDRVTEAYLDALPFHRNLLGNALVIAPLKLAIEARAFARGLDFPHPHTRYTAHLVGTALDRLAKG